MIPARLANTLWCAAARSHHRQFARSARNLAGVQAALLHGILARNAPTRFGRRHHFDRLRTVQDYRDAVPLTTYDDYSPFIARIIRGEPGVLTRDPVTHLVPTSGSTSARKLIPWTAGLQRDFNRAIDPWIRDLFSGLPDLKRGPAYWSVSPAAPEEEIPGARIRIGLDDDTDYLGGLAGRLLRNVMAVPPEVRHVWDTGTFRFLVLLHLVAARGLRLISVWHPTFLTLLLDHLPHHFEAIVHSLRTGTLATPRPLPDSLRRRFEARWRAHPARARELESLGPGRPDALWPDLQLLSAWGDRPTPERNDLTSRFPKVRFQAKGLLATEAVVTIPFAGQTPLAANSHFFEFQDGEGRLLLAHQLERGRRYEVIVTTSGGLYRYQLRDQVEAVGFLHDLPSLRFVGRAGPVTDLRGEKLDARCVGAILDDLTAPFAASLRFRLLAADPDEQPLRYHLVLVSDAPLDCAALAEILESRLAENPHYRLCRFLGQLHRARVSLAPPEAVDRYFAWRTATGAKIGDLKPLPLDTGPGLLACFRCGSAHGLQPAPSGIESNPRPDS